MVQSLCIPVVIIVSAVNKSLVKSSTEDLYGFALDNPDGKASIDLTAFELESMYSIPSREPPNSGIRW